MDNSMPSKKPRINLTVDEDINVLLDDISSLTGTPKARFITGIIDEMKPMLLELREALQLVEQKKSVISNLAKLSSIANEKTGIINNEMADLYKNQIDWIEDTKND